MTCSVCKIEKTISHLPVGWKRDNDILYCQKCWAEGHVLRAVSAPVVEPLSGTWQELRAALGEMWQLTTRASNWMMTEFYARDVRRNDQAKMPPMPRIYLYPEGRALFPALPPQAIAALEQSIRRQYRAKRRDLIWTSAMSLPTVRYPCPYPVHNQWWSVRFDPGNRPIVNVRLGEKRWEFRLRGGPRYWRQLIALRQMVDGSAKRAELALFKHHDGQIICKMVAWLPRLSTAENLMGSLSVRSTADALLVAVDVKGERLWTYNADHIRRWSAEHVKLIQRLSEDQKAEVRKRPPFAQRREAAVRKYRDRMASATHEIAASLANFAARRRYASVQYDDREHNFCPQFSWFDLREKLEYKLNALGIALELARSDPSHKEQAGTRTT